MKYLKVMCYTNRAAYSDSVFVFFNYYHFSFVYVWTPVNLINSAESCDTMDRRQVITATLSFLIFLDVFIFILPQKNITLS